MKETFRIPGTWMTGLIWMFASVVNYSARAADQTNFKYFEVTRRAEATVDDVVAGILDSITESDQALDESQVRILEERYLVHLSGWDDEMSAKVHFGLARSLQWPDGPGPHYHLKSGGFLGLTKVDEEQMSRRVSKLRKWKPVNPQSNRTVYPDSFLKRMCEYVILGPRPN